MGEESAKSAAGVAALLEGRESELGPDMSGPLRVLAARDTRGGLSAEIMASRLVAAAPDDPGLEDVYVPVPVTVRVELDARGAIREADVETDESATREAQAYARNLLATGAVRGASSSLGPRRSPGPPVRPTHELVTDAQGRRILRRVGFTAAPGSPSSDP
ncbi:MAG TPA: hypothetical protein VGQ47_01535 [Candidatus Limnocylindrales bacterium]|nr:hypothetical protein [Candidatus Limnocylindrales bacterium]